MTYKWLLACALGLGAQAYAQSPWPAVLSDHYPMVSSMTLVRHEQSMLLGEAEQQTGVFYSRLSQVSSERVQPQLLADARHKGWKLQSALRSGTQHLLAFTKGSRMLDVRLTSEPDGVEAMYSVVFSQQAPVAVAGTLPAALSTPPSAR